MIKQETLQENKILFITNKKLLNVQILKVINNSLKFLLITIIETDYMTG